MDTGHSIIERANEQRKRTVPVADLEYLATTSRMQDTVTIWNILDTLWRRKWLIFFIVASSTILAGIVVFQATPTFRAQSLLIIESRAPNIASLVNVAAGLPADPETIQSEMVILRSPKLAKKVINRLELQTDPEFNSALRSPGWLEKTFGFTSPDAEAQPAEEVTTAAASREQGVDAPPTKVVNAFLDNLNVSLRGESRVVAVEFLSHDAETATRAVNSLAHVYLQEQREAKQQAAEQDTELLYKRVAALREKVEAADQAVEEYRQRSGLLQGDKGSTLSTQQLTELNTQLTAARAARSQAEAKLREIEKLATTPRGIESSSEIMNSALIQYLREQRVQLRRRIGELSENFGSQHPTIVNLQREIGELNASIRAEANRIIDGYRNDVAVARAREKSVQEDLDELKAEVGQANEKEIQLRSLEREAEADRTLLATFLSRLKETRQQQGMDVQQADARIVSLADEPNDPAFPKKAPVLALAFFGSSLLAMLVVLVSEQRDRGFRSSRQVEETMGMPVLGAVPKLRKFSKPLNISSTRKLRDQSDFALTEAMRSIYESILLSNREGSPRKILITSAVANEGKTSIAVSLARVEALTGSNVVVVDADLRSPDIHHAFNSSRSPGLVDLVAGAADLESVLRKDPASHAWYITAGGPVSDPLSTLTAARLDEILELLTRRYDLVILDSPPSNMFVDARVLSAKVDKTLFVVRWGETPQEAVLDAFKRHAQSGSRLSGVVLSMTDGKIYSQYG